MTPTPDDGRADPPGYKWTAGLSDAGFHDRYSGFVLAMNVGWLFGRGEAAPRH